MTRKIRIKKVFAAILIGLSLSLPAKCQPTQRAISMRIHLDDKRLAGSVSWQALRFRILSVLIKDGFYLEGRCQRASLVASLNYPNKAALSIGYSNFFGTWHQVWGERRYRKM